MKRKIMYNELFEICNRPEPFSVYTAERLWNDPHISQQMLKYHLNPDCDAASRNKAHIDKTIDWITNNFNIDKSTNICDFGCGPGLYSIEFAKKGAQVTGVDFSRRSIEYARSQASMHSLKIEYLNENYLNYNSVKKYDLIVLIYLDFCVLSPEQRRQLFSVFSKCLKSKGSILFDVPTINAFQQKRETSIFKYNLMDGFWSEHNYYGFENCFKYDDIHVALDKYSIVEDTGIWHVYNWFQYFSKESIQKELNENGFNITGYYSDTTGKTYDSESNEIAIIGQKV